MEQDQLIAAVEAILFISDRPVSTQRLMEVLATEAVSEQELSAVIDEIKARYESPSRGFELREAQGGFHFTTKTSTADWIRKFLQTKPFRLGRSALEVLAIIAYRQPVTRIEIDKIRGIDSSHLMRTLIERGLVKMAGKAEVPGRPVQYGTTPRFLEVTGLQSLAELPPLSELEQLQGNTEDPLKPLEDGLNRFVAEQVTRAEVDAVGEDTSGLDEIDTMIQSISKPDRELHLSEVHAEVAAENEAALEGFLAFWKPVRKSRKAAAAAVSEEIIVPPADGEGTPSENPPPSEMN